MKRLLVLSVLSVLVLTLAQVVVPSASAARGKQVGHQSRSRADAHAFTFTEAVSAGFTCGETASTDYTDYEDASSAQAGQCVAYRITLKNTGTVALGTALTLADVLPSGLSFYGTCPASITTGTATCTNRAVAISFSSAALHAGATDHLVLTVQIPETATCGQAFSTTPQASLHGQSLTLTASKSVTVAVSCSSQSGGDEGNSNGGNSNSGNGNGNNGDEGNSGQAAVTLCHLTSSASNPYVLITVAASAVQTHLNHGDVYPDSSGACPSGTGTGNGNGGGPVVDSAQTVSVNLCKSSIAGLANNSIYFQFTVPTGVNTTATVYVPLGGCTAVSLPVGQQTISEATGAFTTSDGTTFSAVTGSSFGITGVTGTNITASWSSGQTFTVQPTGATSNASVWVTNAATTGLVVCKSASGVPVGTTFSFTVSGPGLANTVNTTAVAGGACSAPIFGLTGNATVTETGLTNSGYQVASVSVTGGTLTTSTTANPAIVTPGTGVTTVTFTNAAAGAVGGAGTGTIELCKSSISGLANASLYFQFSLPNTAGGTQTVYVPLGGCTMSIAVPAGQQLSITEAAGAYSLSSGTFTAVSGSTFGITGVSGTNLTPGWTTGQTFTTTVAANSSNGIITVTNAPATSIVKVCKAATGVTAGTIFSFTVSGTGVPNSPVNTTAAAGFCSLPIFGVTGDVTVTETNLANSGYQFSSVAVTGGTLTSSTTTNPAAVTPGAGVTEVTFTNATAGVAGVSINCPASSQWTVTTGYVGSVLSYMLSAPVSAGAAISSVALSNTSTNVTSFSYTASTSTSGTVNATIPYATGGSLTFTVTADGVTATCDPVPASVKRVVGSKNVTLAASTSVPLTVDGADHYLQITNGTPGITGLHITVNGRTITVSHLKAGKTRQIDLASVMHAGSNTVTLAAIGKPGGTANLLFVNVPSSS